MSKQFKIMVIMRVDFEEDVNEYWIEDLLRDFINLQDDLFVETIKVEEIYK